MRPVFLAVALLLSLVVCTQAQTQRAAFNEIRGKEHTAPDVAFDEMMSLAEAGYAPAFDRVGYYLRHGIGTKQNLSEARQWYLRAVAAEHPWSFANLARLELKLGEEDKALRLLTAAAEEGRPGTERLLATSHIDRHFGAASQPQIGRNILEHLIAQGDKNAARDLALRLNWGRLKGQLPDPALTQIVQVGLEGDARFAEAALVYASRQPGKNKIDAKTRTSLASVPGVRDKVVSVDRVHLAADTDPAHFWSHVETILAETKDQNYSRVARVAISINKNARVRVLQMELRALGYYHGRSNGRVTTSTIRAQNQFCRAKGIWPQCAQGPLRAATVGAVAAEISATKASSESQQTGA